MLKDLILRNRSYRRFHQAESIDRATLESLIELARLSPSASNLQPLRFILSCEPERNAVIFPLIAWAGYLTDWPGPAEGERPAAYIIILADRQISESIRCDHGIAAQSILLGAAELGLGGCLIASVQREKLREALGIADRYEILLVMALGKPAETVVLDTVDAQGSIEYWRDADDVHHVPKRRLADLIIG